MAKHRTGKQRKKKQSPPSASAERPAAVSYAPATAAMAATASPAIGWITGIAALLAATAASGMMVLDHLGGLTLPGCGPGSPCAEAAASVWGKVPGIGWPVSFLGTAYFVAMLVAWSGARSGVPAAFRNLARVGMLISIGYAAVMIFGKHLCWYCLATHAANLLFWIMCERHPAATAASPTRRPMPAFGASFAGVTAVLAVALAIQTKAAEKKDTENLEQSITKLTQSASRPSARPVTVYSDANPFTGRWRIGPEKAAIRLVVFSDFQCPDCYLIEQDIRAQFESHREAGDMSVSFKHFPMCTDCNKFLNRNMHANACWGARAAEAAGMIRGNAGFWEMHRWLFDIRGDFDDAQLNQALARMGYNQHEFLSVMMGDESLRRVKQDIDEGQALGLTHTPMIFINGVELLGWRAPKAVERAVQALAATNPEPATCLADRPPTSVEKFYRIWRDTPAVQFPPDATSWSRGPADAPVRIVFFGDYQEPFTAKANARLMKIMAGRSDVWFSYRHYPMNQACNPAPQHDPYPHACRAARAAEAAGRLAGSDGYWKMHGHLLANQQPFADAAALQRAAEATGLDAAALAAMMETAEVKAAIDEDIQAGQAVQTGGVPGIFIQGRKVQVWLTEGLLERIVEAVASGEAETVTKP